MTSPRHYVISSGKMLWKVGDELVDIPLPLTPEIEREVDEVWKEYDARGRPFLSYHNVPAGLA